MARGRRRLAVDARRHGPAGSRDAPRRSKTLPYSELFLQDFEYRYCNDRYWDRSREHDWPDTRFMSTGHAFVVVGDVEEPFFTDEASGVLALFRHQHFLLGLIAHFPERVIRAAELGG